MSGKWADEKKCPLFQNQKSGHLEKRKKWARGHIKKYSIFSKSLRAQRKKGEYIDRKSPI